jgi:transposase InsO family protein
MITYLDDYSRYIIGSKKAYDPTTENALRVLEKSVKKHGLPEQILTDRGTQFYAEHRKNEKPKTNEFTLWCKQRIYFMV